MHWLTVVRKNISESKISFLSSIILAAIYGPLFVYFFPTLTDGELDLAELYSVFSPELLEGFGFSSEGLSTFESFISGEYFGFVWIILYLPFAAMWAGKTAMEAETGLLAVNLAKGVRRSTYLLGNFGAFAIKVIILSAVIVGGVYFPAVVQDIEFNQDYWHILYARTVLFLLVAGALVNYLGVMFMRRMLAVGGAMGVFVVMFMCDLVAKFNVDLESLRYTSVWHYLGQPANILTSGDYEIEGFLLVGLVTTVLLVLSVFTFSYRDIEVG